MPLSFVMDRLAWSFHDGMTKAGSLQAKIQRHIIPMLWRTQATAFQGGVLRFHRPAYARTSFDEEGGITVPNSRLIDGSTGINLLSDRKCKWISVSL